MSVTDASENSRFEGVNREDLRKSMDTLFPQSKRDRCRVCDEPVVDGRWNYCSERCREIAQAVQRMFIWDEVREEVLERDDYTCQECDLSKDRWWRAYHQIYELVYDHVGRDGSRLPESAMIEAPSRGGFHVDHIKPISDGGHPFDESNLQTLCKHCHHAKTAKENRSGEDIEERPEIGLEEYL